MPWLQENVAIWVPVVLLFAYGLLNFWRFSPPRSIFWLAALKVILRITFTAADRWGFSGFRFPGATTEEELNKMIEDLGKKDMVSTPEVGASVVVTPEEEDK